MKQAVVDVDVRIIMAGKYRRYHDDSWLHKLLDLKTNLYNLRDIFFILIGILQALWLVWRFSPDVIFAKGGYVCIPVGVAAKLLGVPLVIHDSDTRPGLTNKLLSRWASAIATGAPLKYYNYPAKISAYTGVPIDSAFHPVSDQQKIDYKRKLGIDDDQPLIVITGGGLGAQAINQATVRVGDRLVKQGYGLYHITGRSHYQSVRDAMVRHPNYQAVEFVYEDMISVLGAADLVVSRASATFLQELAGLAKPVVAIPAKSLGDQQQNAKVFAEADSVVVLEDDEIARGDKYFDTIDQLMKDEKRRRMMADNLHKFAKPEAAQQVASMIVAQVKGGQGEPTI